MGLTVLLRVGPEHRPPPESMPSQVLVSCTRTSQRTLILRQVKDLMEVALLGGVAAAGLFIFAQAGRCAGHVAS